MVVLEELSTARLSQVCKAILAKKKSFTLQFDLPCEAPFKF
jgi:hypothetical protein